MVAGCWPYKRRWAETAGLTLEQAADCLDISRATAVRDWLYARAWLFDALAGDQSEKN
jgi:predicted DNA-binding protein (UPF0251 family)